MRRSLRSARARHRSWRCQEISYIRNGYKSCLEVPLLARMSLHPLWHAPAFGKSSIESPSFRPAPELSIFVRLFLTPRYQGYSVCCRTIKRALEWPDCVQRNLSFPLEKCTLAYLKESRTKLKGIVLISTPSIRILPETKVGSTVQNKAWTAVLLPDLKMDNQACSHEAGIMSLTLWRFQQAENPGLGTLTCSSAYTHFGARLHHKGNAFQCEGTVCSNKDIRIRSDDQD